MSLSLQYLLAKSLTITIMVLKSLSSLCSSCSSGLQHPLSLCAKFVVVFLVFSVISSLIGSIIIPTLFTTIISNVIEKIMVLSPSSELYAGWKDPDMPIYQNFYFFDIQNKEDVRNGAKPHVLEVGPYTYMVNLTRQNVTFEGNDTLSFMQFMSFTFMPEMSAGTEEDIITTVNLPLMTSAVNTKYESWLARFTISAIAQIHEQEILTSISIRDLLWGYQDPVLNQLQDLIGDDVITTDMFGLLLGQNGSSGVNQFTINTGETDPYMLNRIQAWNGKTSLSWWGNDEANMINGTDGTMFYPGVKQEDTLYVFNPFSFRSMPFVYQNDTSYEDVTLYHFYIPPYAYASPSEYPPNAGFCQEEDCPPSGILNISACSQGVPMSLSLPHFLYGDDELIDSIDGIEPNETLHQNSMDIDPIMGVPFLIHQRTQINIHIEEVTGIRQTTGLPTLHFPMLWIETHGVLPDSIISDYKSGMALGVRIGVISRYSCIAVGLSCLILAIVIIKRSRDNSARREQDKAGSLKKKEAISNDYISISDKEIAQTIQYSETNIDIV